MKQLTISAAPENLWQSINPWTFSLQGAQFGLFNFNLGATPAPETEEKILEDVGSYGRQIGRIGDALDVLLRHVKLENLTRDEEDALTILKGQLAEVRKIKSRMRQENSARE